MNDAEYKRAVHQYRARNKGMHILLSNSQAGPGRTVKQEQEEISRNHVPRLLAHLCIFREIDMNLAQK